MAQSQTVDSLDLDSLSAQAGGCPAAGPQLTSDTWRPAIRQFDQHCGYIHRLSRCLADARVDPQHSIEAMLAQRLYGVLADYEDVNDRQTLRHDPMFKLIGQRSIDAEPLACQPTLSRARCMRPKALTMI